ncbi:hypothetical protein OG936_13540 [Streptomyces sp. NBC_00846]|uniref:hypothetical protein n=1 Tax=Streptomyces sp. NBC_00846 TaxID=2975849 RepID=UPI003863E0A9|nr:hypothetical protein OG936_13540 [Streptomyces sp. NBC_00846]
MRGHTGVTSHLILRGRGTTAHFEGRSVLLEQNGTHRHIPVRAIQEVRAAGARGDRAEIELTSAGGDPTVFVVTRSSPAAVTAFVSAVTSALPERRAPRDGMELVSEETSAAPAWRLFLTRHSGAVAAAVCAVVLWAALVVYVAATGEPGQWLMPLFGALILLAAGRYLQLAGGIMRDHWSTRRNGITVAATSAGRNSARKEIWRFTDAEGRARTYVGSGKIVSRDPRRIEVRYDPRHPDKLYAPQPVLVYVVVGVVVTPMLAGLLAMGVWLTLWQLVDVLMG